MNWARKSPGLIDLNCLQRQHWPVAFAKNYGLVTLRYSSTSRPQQERSIAEDRAEYKDTNHTRKDAEEVGGMSRRLAQMTDESLDYGGRSAEKAIEEAGFSEELKRQLEERINDSKFRSDHPAAFVELNMPVSLTFFSKMDGAKYWPV